LGVAGKCDGHDGSWAGEKDLIRWKLGRIISVMDWDFFSEENLRTLQKEGGHYIVGEKM
jgi:hypothetical protein